MSRKRSHQESVDSETQPRESQPNSSSNELTRPVAVPRISKARACAECKRHKIKCEVLPGESSCTKCLRGGLKCVANDFSQRFVDDDGIWKSRAMTKIQQLQSAVSQLLRQSNLPELSTYGSEAPENQDAPKSVEKGNSRTVSAATMDVTRENSQEPSLEDPELVPAPMRSLYEVTKLRNLRSHPVNKPRSRLLEEDFISRGFISVQEAEELFDYFSRFMNQLLWGGIILVHNDLTSARRGSSLLSAAVLTVAALHIPNKTETLIKCYDEFVSLVSSTSLTRYHTLDDVRALCIGAFWLSDLSWKLSGHGVRIATEMNLHQSFQKMTRGHSDQYERAQLWYLLYVCDHQFSIAYGRPPVIHEDQAIRNYETYLQSPSTVPGDTRLIAQVALFVILTEAYRVFGSDTEQALTEDDFAQLRIYNVAVEKWRLLWQPRSADSPYVRTYPSKGVVLHYHFAKFQLNSLALRAISPNTAFSMDRKESANIAISSAMSTLSLVLEEPDIRDAIVGVPLFTHTMVTFSAVFLLKVAVNWNSSAYLSVDANQVQSLIEKVIDLLTRVRAGERHLTRHIASGLSKMLERFKETHDRASEIAAGSMDSQTGNGDVNQLGELPPDMLYDMVGAYGFGLDEHLLDPSMANFGFLAS